MRLDIVKILGVNKAVHTVTINGKDYSKFLYNTPDQVIFLKIFYFIYSFLFHLDLINL